jgi:hypothetical protein
MTRLQITEQWATARNMPHLVGVDLPVVQIDEYANGRKFFTVELPDGRKWVVADFHVEIIRD